MFDKGAMPLAVSLCGAHLLLVLAVIAVNVALVSVGADLGLDGVQSGWIVTSYLAMLGGTLLIGARLADLVGRRRCMLGGLVAFVGASVLAAVASNPSVLIVGRLLQGMAGAVVMPTVLTITAAAFPEPLRRARMMAALAGTSAVGGSAGVLLAGAVCQVLSWRWVFSGLAALGIVVAALAVRALPRDVAGSHARADLWTPLAGGLALASLVACLQQGGQLPGVVWLVPPALGVLFLRLDRASLTPVVRVVGRRAATTRNLAVVTCSLSSAVHSGVLFMLIIAMRSDWGWSPVRVGLALVPFGLAMLAGSWTSAVVQRRAGIRLAIALALAQVAGGALLVSLAGPGDPIGWVVLTMLVMPLGTGAMPALTGLLGLSEVAGSDASAASALLSIAHHVGGAMGVAAVAAASQHVGRPAILLSGAAITFAVGALTVPRVPQSLAGPPEVFVAASGR